MLCIQVSSDGIVTFDGKYGYGMNPFDVVKYEHPVVTAFVADIDTSNNAGRLYFRETMDSEILERATNDVADGSGFLATWVFIATWKNVTYYSGNSTSPVRAAANDNTLSP